MRGKDKNYFPIFSLKRPSQQLWVDFVENKKKPTRSFTQRNTKSGYHNYKIIYRCFENSISKSDRGRNLNGLFAYISLCAWS